MGGATGTRRSACSESTPARRLNANVGTDRKIYRDLGTGASYETFRIPTSDRPRSLVRLTLEEGAVARINRSRDGRFSIGGSLPSADGDENQYLFGNSRDGGAQRLVMYYREPDRAR